VGRLQDNGPIQFFFVFGNAHLDVSEGTSMPKKPTYGELQKRIAELEAQQQRLTEISEKRAEDSLHKERQRLQMVLDSITDGLLMLDHDWRYTYFSKTGAKMIGMRPEDLIGRCVWDLFPHAKGTKFYEGYHQAVETGQPVHFEEFYAEPLNQWLECHCYPTEDGLTVYFHNITERKRTDESLATIQSLFQSIINSTTSIIYAFDLEERFVMANTTVAVLLNSTPEQMIGKRRHEFMPKADADWHEANDRQVIETGRMMEFEEQSHLVGRSITWLTTKFPIRDAQGRIYAIGGISADISARKEAEEQIKKSQKTFSELVERAPFGIYVIDSQFCVAHMNARSQAGAFRNVKPLIGRNFTEVMRVLWPEPVAIEIIGHFRHTLETGEPYYSPRFTNPRHDIEIIESYEWELHRIKLQDGQYGVICYYFDSTELRNAQLALKEANATLEKKVQERTLELSERAAQLRALTGELTLAEQRERNRLATILHDHLQQMLVAAKFRLTVLGRSRDDVVTQAAKEVEEMIDESIVASRSLTAELSPPILHEAGLTEGLQWLAKRMADTQGLFVGLELNESVPLSEDLKILLFQSVRELLFNVVKHAKTRSAVVNLRCLDGSLQVTVSDQGSGFDPAAMPLAGEGGRGFGLLGIQERLKYMGGTLVIESNPGQGSRFVLSVPVSTLAANEPTLHGRPVMPEARLIAAPKHPDPARKIRVMLADDHAIVRQGIANLLTDEPDIEVVGQAADGQEAVELAAKLLPDVILMDASMPKLNGVEATRAIRNEFPEIRIIGLSMFDDAERAQAMRDAGAVDYATKSGRADALINLVRTSIRAEKTSLYAKT
jgi:PAS domain S-box-containing protein